MDDWLAQLEDQTGKSPRETILISFLAGALLQVFASHALLIRLVSKLGSPIVITFAAWRLYRSIHNRRSSSAGESIAVHQS